MSKKATNQQIIENDILKYKTNKFAATLALVAIVFSCLYFCLLYSFRSTYFAKWEIGVSVILTLFSLLITFLASEGIKGYNKKYSIVLIVLAVVQIIRIFGLPLQALNYDVANGNANVADVSGVALTVRYFGADLTPSVAYVILVVWLSASAASLVAAAVIGYFNCVKLESHLKMVENGEIDIDVVLAEMDKEEEKAVNVGSKAILSENESKLIEEDENA